MDYDSHMRAVMHSSLCKVVDYGEGHEEGSMMALMTTEQAPGANHHPSHARQHSHHAQHHHHQQQQHPSHEPHHQQHHNDHSQHLSIWHSNTVSSASLPPSSFTYYNATMVEPYLQSALQQTTHAFNQSHHSGAHTPLISALDNLEPSSLVVQTEDAKPDIVAPKIGRDMNYAIAATFFPSLLVSPGAISTTHENTGAAMGAASMKIRNTHSSSTEQADPVKAKIVSHPTYPRLVMSHVNSQKIGTSAEVVASLDEVSKKYQTFRASSPTAMGPDPELDHFMETYCNVLQKYHDELMQPYKEAMAFFRKIELQLNALSKGTLHLSQSGTGKCEKMGEDMKGKANIAHSNNGSSAEEEREKEGDASCGEVDFHEENMIDPLAEDQKLKEQLLRKYGGLICSLKQEFLKKKKKGKLPKESRQKLLDWWNQHYKSPYPFETEKSALAEATGLDQKQINSWFINQRRRQRKRHWKPSQDVQNVIVDSPSTAHHHHVHTHAHAHAHLVGTHPLASYAVVETMDAAAAAAVATTIMPALQ